MLAGAITTDLLRPADLAARYGGLVFALGEELGFDAKSSERVIDISDHPITELDTWSPSGVKRGSSLL